MMNIYAPDYYPLFHCIAGACNHTCCVGWEIDIDSESLERYRKMKGKFGEHIRSCISLSPEPHFMLSEGEKCPLLTSDHLCEIILHKGESYLCQICADHPRFRNYWSDRIEMGLGLACEEAARMILSSDHPLRLIQTGIDPDEEAEEASEAEKDLMTLRNRMLTEIEATGPKARLMEYLIYRHLADALYDGQVDKRISFIQHAYQSILKVWDRQSFQALVEIARAFSNQFEYDDEGMDLFLANPAL